MVLGVSVNGKTEYLEAVGSHFHLLMIYFCKFCWKLISHCLKIFDVVCYLCCCSLMYSCLYLFSDITIEYGFFTGMADVARKVPLQKDSLFRIYSQTKAITRSANAHILCQPPTSLLSHQCSSHDLVRARVLPAG